MYNNLQKKCAHYFRDLLHKNWSDASLQLMYILSQPDWYGALSSQDPSNQGDLSLHHPHNSRTQVPNSGPFTTSLFDQP